MSTSGSISLTPITHFDILSDISPECWPPEISSNSLHGDLLSEMSSSCTFMVFFEYGSCLVFVDAEFGFPIMVPEVKFPILYEVAKGLSSDSSSFDSSFIECVCFQEAVDVAIPGAFEPFFLMDRHQED